MSDESLETEGQFAQFATESGVLDWLLDSDPGEAEEAPADTVEAQRPRDEQGRFAKVEAAEEAETPNGDTEDVTPSGDTTEETEEPEQAPDGDVVIEIDDDLQAILDKYDGDVTKALKALGDSQSMIGRQANEVGQLRQELAAMRQALEEGFARQPQQQFMGPYQNDIDENPQGLVVEAMERGDATTMEMALRAWGEEDPFAASSFLFTLQAQAAQAQAQQVQGPTTPDERAGTGPTIEQAMADVVTRHPDVEKYLPQVQQVAAEFPTLRNSMQQGPPAAKAQAFEELLVIAKNRSQAGDTSAAMRKVVLRAQEEVRAEKADAAVVSAQNQTAATRQTRLDEFYTAFGEAADRYQSKDWISQSND